MGVTLHLPRRASALALALGVALGAAGGIAPVRAATPGAIADPAGTAAGWVATQVASGSLSASDLDSAIFALAGAHVGGTAAASALVQLKASADAYVGYGGTLKAGALGAVTLAVTVAGGDPTSFNGHNLVADLRGLLVTSGTDAGVFGDPTNATIYGQSLDILALAATPGGVPAGAGAWLASKQCAAGDYSWNGACPVAAGSEDPDSTAIALQALLAAGNTAAADKATSWLLGYQSADGSFAAYGDHNANSTGAAAEALRAAGKAAAADRAAAFLASLQYGCGAAAADRGAIPYTSTNPGYGGPFSSTAQAVLGFGAGRLDTLTIAGATASSPTLSCPVPTATPIAVVRPAPTEPPTDAAVVPAPAGTSSQGTLLLAVALLALGGALGVGLRAGARR